MLNFYWKMECPQPHPSIFWVWGVGWGWGGGVEANWKQLKGAPHFTKSKAQARGLRKRKRKEAAAAMAVWWVPGLGLGGVWQHGYPCRLSERKRK